MTYLHEEFSFDFFFKMDPNRPNRDETDEDLLRMQREFLASKGAPAAKVVRVGDKRKPETNNQSNAAAARDVVSLGNEPETSKASHMVSI